MANLKNAKHAKIETREPGIVARAGMAALMASTVATPPSEPQPHSPMR